MCARVAVCSKLVLIMLVFGDLASLTDPYVSKKFNTFILLCLGRQNF